MGCASQGKMLPRMEPPVLSGLPESSAEELPAALWVSLSPFCEMGRM